MSLVGWWKFGRKPSRRARKQADEMLKRLEVYSLYHRHQGAIAMAAILLRHDKARGRFVLKHKNLTYNRLQTLVRHVVEGEGSPEGRGEG